MAWEPKINRHVAVVVTIGGKTRRRPGIITGFAADSAPIIRVGHHDTDAGTGGVQLEIYGDSTNGVVRRTTTADNTVPRYTSW